MKIEEAKTILKEIGMPVRQQTESFGCPEWGIKLSVFHTNHETLKELYAKSRKKIPLMI